MKQRHLFLLAALMMSMSVSCRKPEKKDQMEPQISFSDSGKVTVVGDGALSAIFSDYPVESIDTLSVLQKTLNQDDLNFIAQKLNVNVLDLQHSTLNVRNSDYCFKSNKSVRQLILPENLTAVGFGHLAYTDIESITFTGEMLKRIGSGAFAFSSKINKLVLPESLSVLEAEAFIMMPNIESIIIPKNVTVIPDRCFALSQKLESVVFEGSVKVLGNGAFSHCKSLTRITFKDSTPASYSQNDWPFTEREYLYNEDGTPRLKFYIPAGSLQEYRKVWGFDGEGDERFFVEY